MKGSGANPEGTLTPSAPPSPPASVVPTGGGGVGSVVAGGDQPPSAASWVGPKRPHLRRSGHGFPTEGRLPASLAEHLLAPSP